MLPLDSPLWSTLNHHFGNAESTPLVLEDLKDCLDAQPLDEARYKRAVSGLESEIDKMFHQANICTAIGAAMPHILELLGRLRVEDQVENYFVCGWMHTEGAGWVCEDQQVQDWYKIAEEKAKKDIVEIAKSNKLDEDDQFFLFFALDAFHDEHYTFSIRDRSELETECRSCDEKLLCEFGAGIYEATCDANNVVNLVEPHEDIEKLMAADAYRRTLYNVAKEGGHREFENWLGLMHSPFHCPACSQITTILPD